MTDSDFTTRSSLSIDTMESDNDDQIETERLRTRILNIVKSSKDHTIRPATLSAELGISMDEANAELCGLLKAVGKGSTFHFENVNGVNTMVFNFPPNFERRAARSERKEDFLLLIRETAVIVVKVAKMITAFGLILSTFIVSIAGMVAMVAALVALSRGGRDSRNAQNTLARQMRGLFEILRQLLWCYSMFGPTGEDGQDPFFREAAYDTSLIMSLCCGNPANMWFWMRARHLRRRRRRYTRGWGANNTGFAESVSDLEGVSLIRRGARGEEQIPVPAPSDDHRGLLSVLVEFLFGPTTTSGPSEEEKWRLRGAVIVNKLMSRTGSISLQELAPFADSPPPNLDGTARIVSEGLSMVSHFNGKPARKPLETSEDLSNSLFDFPELVAESRFATQYSGPRIGDPTSSTIFFLSEMPVPSSSGDELHSLPEYLYEERKLLTNLTSNQFFRCLLIAILNLIGVIWFAQSLDPGGILEQNLGAFGKTLKWGLIPVLLFYAKFFFFIPLVRLSYIFAWNQFSGLRNKRRQKLATLLKVKPPKTAPVQELSEKT
eukprot:scaffold16396_cov140-Cylindrotheca_fusiformis.AAC.9